jgi:hypothetical protein
MLWFALIVGFAILGAPPGATAATYEWQGTCAFGCVGSASGVLTLADGATPLDFGLSEFVSFEFNSSSGAFFLNNSSPYLAVANLSGPLLLLEENALGPNTLPLWQFAYSTSALPTLTLSPDLGAWQFLSGAYGWTCLNAECTAWTDDVIRNVGVGGFFADHTAVPIPSAAALFATGLGLIGLLARRRKRLTQ